MQRGFCTCGGEAACFDGNGTFLHFHKRAQNERSNQWTEGTNTFEEITLCIQSAWSAGRQ